MAFVYDLFSKLREGAKHKPDTVYAPEPEAAQEKRQDAGETHDGLSEADRQQLERLDARIRSLEDRLREQGF